MKSTAKLLSAAALAILAAAGSASAAETPVPAGAKNILIVPGAFVDGSGWRVVHDILIHKGYTVTVAQERFGSIHDDVALINQLITRQDGPTVLVGHDYGGSVISFAGTRQKVKALVYVAGLQPDIGESASMLLNSMPAASDDFRPTLDGKVVFDRAKFGEDYAGDLSTNRTDFMAASQVPIMAAALAGQVLSSPGAWRGKPSYGIVATDDRVVSPDLQRWMYHRAGSSVTEIKASHAVYISQPEQVAAVIEQAALAAK